MRRALVLVMIAAAACKSDAGTNASPIVRAIGASEQLIGGIEASGRLGDYLIANERVRFVVQDAASATGWGFYGGSLVDLGRAGGAGDDRLQELFFQCDLRAFAAERAEIVSDGSDGPGILRLVGKDGGIPLLDPIIASKALDVETSVDFVLAPGSDTLEIIQRAQDLRRTETRSLSCGIVLITGDAYRVFVDRKGNDSGAVSGRVPYVAAASEDSDVSFVLYRDEGTLGTLAPQSEVIVLDAEERPFLATDTREDRYFLGLGLRGDVESALETMRRRLEPETPRRELAIQLGVSSGLRLDRVLVDIQDLAKPERSRAVTQARASASGLAQVRLTPGLYRAVASVDGRELGSAEVEITAAEGPALTIMLAIEGLGVLRVRSFDVDRDGRVLGPTAAKLTAIEGRDMPPGAPRFLRAYLAPEDEVMLPAGEYTIYVSRGPEHGLHVENVALASGTSVEIEARVPRVVDSSGWVSADLHVHAAKSMDASTARKIRVLGAIAEGLDVLVATDHDIISDYGPIASELGVGSMIHTVAGIEASPLWGHINGFPLAAEKPERYWGVTWFEYDERRVFQRMIQPAELVRQLRERGARIVQLNHPRGDQGVFNFLDLDPSTAAVSREWPEADAFELMNPTDEDPGLMDDWFGLIRNGRRLTATGVSDAHGVFGVGYSRTLIASPEDDPATIADAEIWPALAAGRAVATNGPFVRFSARRGSAEAGIGETLAGAGQLALSVRVEAPEWMDVASLRILENGRTLIEQPLTAAERDPENPAVRLDRTYTATAADAFYVLVVEGTPGSRNEPVFGSTALAITNPIYVDLD